MKPHIPLTLISVDTGNRVELTSWAIKQCLDRATFDAVKLLTHNMSQPHAVQIPRFEGVHGYSTFVVRHLHEYFDTSHCLIVQWDGFMLNPLAWQPRFLNFDYIGAAYGNWVGIGGFSLRSHRFMKVASTFKLNESGHPEDSWLSLTHRREFELKHGIRYAPTDVANGFTMESRNYNARANVWSGTEKKWQGQFGFHSYLTPLPNKIERPNIFHHSGDFGDFIYSLPTIKALGGGMLYISPEATPMRVRNDPTPQSVNSITSLLQYQHCVWSTVFAERRPYSVDYDLNQFRRYYSEKRHEMGLSLLAMTGRTFGVEVDGREPWLTIPDSDVTAKPIVIARSERYNNNFFPWRRMTNEFRSRMQFVGTQREYDIFSKAFGAVEFHPTRTILDLANVIKSAKVFIGNQSCPLSIALGLGKNTICEVWRGDPNCKLPRENAIYADSDKVDIPQSWL